MNNFLTRLGIVATIFICFCETSKISAFPHLDRIKPSASSEAQQQAVEALAARRVGNKASKQFQFVVDSQYLSSNGKEQFTISQTGKSIQIKGTTGVVAALGFQYYLKTFCNLHFAWSGARMIIPEVLPSINGPITITMNDKFRYYQNVCTVSYTFAWWNFKDWEREIDWMALNGINLPLAFNGQEEIWAQTFKLFGCSDDDNNAFFTGPAFFAWNRMGNLRQFAGNLSTEWHTKQRQLQHQILDRMRSLGMIPVLPAFAGHVPRAMETITFINPTDPLFTNISTAFMKLYTKEYGTDHIYNFDLFNEMTPDGDIDYIAKCSSGSYNALRQVDPDAVWLMQGWLFQDRFWTADRAKALLTAVPTDRMIVLDLYAEQKPIYKKFDNFYGHPFIWCMLHNFGGTSGLFGNFNWINEGVWNGRNYPNSTMIGIGLTPEGIHQNEIIYEFMNEQAYQKKPLDVEEWVSNFTLRRYGVDDKNLKQGWQLLRKSVYSVPDPSQSAHGSYPINRRPSLNMNIPNLYNISDIVGAFQTMFEALEDHPELLDDVFYNYDMTDVAREMYQSIFNLIYIDMINAYKSRNMQAFLKTESDMGILLNMTVSLLERDSHFSLAAWIQKARAIASSPTEADLFEYNARNQISIWGPKGEIRDYASKHWDGLFQEYVSA